MPKHGPAVVVGLCAHGLSIVRDLSDHGVDVHALESNTSLPGVWTRKATVHSAADINSSELIDSLLAVRAKIGSRINPVLFLTNDNMVRRVADDWDRLAAHYRLSWGHCRNSIVDMLSKSAVRDRCSAVGLNFPRSAILNALGDVESLMSDMAFPVVVKPVAPLGSFKVKRFETPTQFWTFIRHFDLTEPLIVQSWIEGDDRSLSFSALLLNHGQVAAHFEGRKLASHPPALGQTLAAQSCADDELYAAARQFFSDLRLSGPVSLEIKRDTRRRMWVIEPTVGRTDYWLPLCVRDGVPLPYLEYLLVTQPEGLPASVQRSATVWYDTEKDPLCYLRLGGGRSAQRGVRAVYSYWYGSDVLPFLRAIGWGRRGLLRRLGRAVMRRLRHRKRGSRPARAGH